jgi:hypothetical protein
MRWNWSKSNWAGKITPLVDFGNDYIAGKQLFRAKFQLGSAMAPQV